MGNGCILRESLNFVGKKWTLLILLELYKGKEEFKRYNRIKSGLKDITPKMLSLRLKDLEINKLIIHETETDKMPVVSRYKLTKRGIEFVDIIKDIKKWSLKHTTKDHKRCSKTDCKYCDF